MTEKEYILVSNRVSISAALAMLSNVLTDEEGTYGLTDEEKREIVRLLDRAETRLFDQIDTSDV